MATRPTDLIGFRHGPNRSSLVVDSLLSPLMELLLLLAMGHFVGDFTLQNDRMAVEKCPGQDQTLPWFWWLTAHAGTHALIVAVLTGMPWLGVAEWLLHGLIDYGKCRFGFSLGIDQALHLLCKVAWAYCAV